MIATYRYDPADVAFALDFIRASGAADKVRRGEWYIREVCIDGWKLRTDGDDIFRRRGMTVIISGAVELDGRRYMHCSISRRKVIPSYADLDYIKDAVFGPDREAYQKFARRREHVNIHFFCLHLFSCLDGDRLPDFTRGSGSI